MKKQLLTNQGSQKYAPSGKIGSHHKPTDTPAVPYSPPVPYKPAGGSGSMNTRKGK